MRGVFARPEFRVAAACFVRRRDLFLLAAAALAIAGVVSGCASVSADRSPARSDKLSIVPALIDFSSVAVSQKNSQTVKITNISGEPLSLDRLTVAGSGFSLHAGKVPLFLAPSKHARFTVEFAPLKAAGFKGALAISCSECGAPINVPLAGTGEKAAPALAAMPASLSFGSHSVKSSSAQTVTLKNTGNVPVSIGSASSGNPAFTVSGLEKGVTLAPDQKLEFQVWFHPSTTGHLSATLAVASAALSQPVKVALAGSATAAAPSSSPDAPEHSVSLDWSSGSNNVAGYHVYRSFASGGPFNRISNAPVSVSNYRDFDVLSGARYFYVVTAVEPDGSESAFSNEVAAVIPD
jgi:transmembrane protein TMEM131/centrosomal CEP192-like protein